MRSNPPRHLTAWQPACAAGPRASPPSSSAQRCWRSGSWAYPGGAKQSACASRTSCRGGRRRASRRSQVWCWTVCHGMAGRGAWGPKSEALCGQAVGSGSPHTAQASGAETVSLTPHHWRAGAKTQSPIILLSLPAGQAPDAETTRWWCLRLKASLDRMRRLCDSFTEAQLGLFAEPARVSEWLGADGWSARMRGCGRVMG